jgi:predicted nucleotidyltransferase
VFWRIFFVRTAGIICEYNPFHLGHQKQMVETRRILGEDTAILCLMSGNFVQRGEPACFPKGLRAEAAVRGGADLVLELPITSAINAAGYFASGAVEYLERLGCVDFLSFGSECGDLEALKSTAEVLESEAFEVALREAMTRGVSYAAARSQALDALGGREDLLKSPNNTLGVEYLRGLKRLGSGIQPVTISRDLSLSSAASLRSQMAGDDWKTQVPDYSIYGDCPVHTLENGQKAMLGVLRTLPEEAFQTMAFDSEGLWSKVMKASRRECSLSDIMMACKSKRYALSRIRRILTCLFLGLEQREMDLKSPYLRVLAFNDRGRALLRKAGETSALPLISGAIPRNPEAKQYFALEARATDLYGLFAPEGVLEPCGLEKAHHPVYVR